MDVKQAIDRMRLNGSSNMISSGLEKALEIVEKEYSNTPQVN